ncbi:hypothetical protein GCM10011360_25670 [Primorskyibacter flagellatus]|uniref:Hedgehog/Intein (Hint) domain-containing protein n=1 Tax=Primorskyibacter flagellatus TaxID=1387277 RepID=A0A917EHH1_9RHOB|nr:Hint domain-containing protein [Primorskyibacter flagellatus]GGE36764.1 hypothetical protein GCM10011360_25670 [Primorskyibacter flagellatus]
MPTQSLYFFDLSYISTDDPDGFSNNGGYQFDLNVNTVTIAPGATETPLSVDDDDTFFDDDDLGQTLNGPHTLNGTGYPSGTIIESEYVLTVRDSDNNDYTLQFISVNNDAFDIVGFVIQGPNPPFGEALTIVGRADNTTGTHSYATSSPACFAPNARIETPRGHVRAGQLRAGDEVCLADGGVARVALVLKSRAEDTEDPDRWPVRIRADALGPGCPKNDVVLSPQHRVYVPALQALVPARALTFLPRVGPVKDGSVRKLVHIVLRTHEVLVADGMPCESFWPGAMALAQLPEASRHRVAAIMGPAPERAAPFLKVRQAIAALGDPDAQPASGALAA